MRVLGPAAGEEIRHKGQRWLVVSLWSDGCYGIVPIPDGMTAMDWGRDWPNDRSHMLVMPAPSQAVH